MFAPKHDGEVNDISYHLGAFQQTLFPHDVQTLEGHNDPQNKEHSRTTNQD